MRVHCKAISASGLCALTLWIVTAAADDAPGSMPGDEAMTCQQIGAELAPYMQRMAGVVMPLADTAQQVVARGQKRVTEAAPAVAAMSAAATATTADPTGISSKVYGQAEAAMQQQVWNQALAEDKPLMDQATRQANQVVAEASPMQSNARIQRLMQLAQQKHCD
jgi:hypothetical protein